MIHSAVKLRKQIRIEGLFKPVIGNKAETEDCHPLVGIPKNKYK